MDMNETLSILKPSISQSQLLKNLSQDVSRIPVRIGLTRWAVKTHTCHKVASSDKSRFKAHAGIFRLLMFGIFDAYVL